MILRRRQLLDSDPEPGGATLSELYHENTKLHPNLPIEFAPSEFGDAESGAMVAAGRRYGRLPTVPLLPRDERADLVSLREAIKSRRSQRTFDPAFLAFDELSELLFLTNGVTEKVLTPSGYVRHLRAAPSAGALYPIEIYLGIRRVSDLPSGLYHFAPREAVLERIREGDPTDDLSGACHYHESLHQAAVVVVFAAVLERTKRKYGERGYRYALIEAGHVAQNLCLASAAMGLGCMTVCGFYDDKLNDLFELDGVEETALYVAYLGKPSPPDLGNLER
jgi:SagB-type dehydrogenase family enzyme